MNNETRPNGITPQEWAEIEKSEEYQRTMNEPLRAQGAEWYEDEYGNPCL